jgi:hypothetical protein
MNPNSSQFPDTLKGYVNNKVEFPDQKDFSGAALSGHKQTKVSPNVKAITPRGGIISPIGQKDYNDTSAALAGMRKSGDLAKRDASLRESSNEGKKPNVVKINSGKAK